MAGRRLALLMIAAFALLVVLALLAVGGYIAEARRHVGADYTAMTTDVVRAQEDAVRLRLTLDSLRASPDPLHAEQLERQLWVIELRIRGITRLLQRSQLPRDEYRPLVAELARLESRLPALRRAMAAFVTGRDPRRLVEVGGELEEGLAWAYSELNERLLEAAAGQRRMMERLTLAVIALAGVAVLMIGGLMLALWRIYQQREALIQQSRTDPLTGLDNRRHLYEVAAQEFARYRRDAGPLSLVLIDLDHFKRINDAYGHPTGDAVLVALARTLLGEVREADRVARLGGEEFAVLLPDSDPAGAARLAERIRARIACLELPERAAGERLTASLGVATATPQMAGLEALYAVADRRLYRAKAEGRDRVVAGVEGDVLGPSPASPQAERVRPSP
ncbi:GGDEF domain-containing protein [Halomonas pacifica]|uniref:GGDEF domain-containing protein n=1 Tax=Bisbaumannia pacifica TaxID=77098 RepID=UPI00235908F6|nr:GGDEF domain-containing protein [Halomonas pacifica]MDC8804582.1 GGDEF domain-containing protein [Halomonas pacifica]